MTAEEFAWRIAEFVHKPIGVGMANALGKPSKGSPSPTDVTRSQFYHSLSEEQKELLKPILDDAARAGIFHFLCVLDHVAFMENGAVAGRFELHYLSDGERTLLNDFKRECLHDLFNAHVGRLSTASVPSSVECKDQRSVRGTQDETGKRQIDLQAAANTSLQPYQTGPYNVLKGKTAAGICVELHHVPEKGSAIVVIANYDPQTAPCIALPSDVHQLIEM